MNTALITTHSNVAKLTHFSIGRQQPWHSMQAFRWRQSSGEMVAVQKMRTLHLFYTFRMIWNNAAPKSLRVGRVRLYTFDQTYTLHYVYTAIRAMADELAHRRDLSGWALLELEQIARNMRGVTAEVLSGPSAKRIGA